MIPRLKDVSPVQSHYLAFIDALRKTGFEGELNPDYANRTVLATDNSIYQVLPQAVIYPRHREDLQRLTRLLSQPDWHSIVISPRGGGTGTNGQSLTDGIVVDLSRHMNRILEINAEEGWVRVEGGAVKDQLNAALKPHGLFFQWSGFGHVWQNPGSRAEFEYCAAGWHFAGNRTAGRRRPR